MFLHDTQSELNNNSNNSDSSDSSNTKSGFSTE